MNESLDYSEFLNINILIIGKSLPGRGGAMRAGAHCGRGHSTGLEAQIGGAIGAAVGAAEGAVGAVVGGERRGCCRGVL